MTSIFAKSFSIFDLVDKMFQPSPHTMVKHKILPLILRIFRQNILFTRSDKLLILPILTILPGNTFLMSYNNISAKCQSTRLTNCLLLPLRKYPDTSKYLNQHNFKFCSVSTLKTISLLF